MEFKTAADHFWFLARMLHVQVFHTSDRLWWALIMQVPAFMVPSRQGIFCLESKAIHLTHPVETDMMAYLIGMHELGHAATMFHDLRAGYLFPTHRFYWEKVAWEWAKTHVWGGWQPWMEQHVQVCLNSYFTDPDIRHTGQAPEGFIPREVA